jgi:hypothetical protein
MSSRPFRRPDFKEATKGNDRVTLITTACYSGEWAELNMTTMAAAGKAQLGLLATVSGGHAGLSTCRLFSRPFAMSARGPSLPGRVENMTAEDKQKTYAAFTDAVYVRYVGESCRSFGNRP